jgi:MFS family permease
VSAAAEATATRGPSQNPALLCAFKAIQMSLFPMAIITIFWQHDVGLSMTEIFTLQAIFAGTTSALEFPSGYLADRIGYRPTLIAAALFSLVGWTVYLFSPGFWTIAVAEVVLGAGLSLSSGTDSAMLYESLSEAGEEERFAVWHGRVRFSGQAAEGTAALAAGLLYTVSPRWPFVLEAAIWLAGVGIAWRLVEPARHRESIESAVAHVVGIFRRIVRGSARLRALMFLTIVLTMTTFVPVWIIQLYTVKAGVDVSWLGPIWAAANYSVAVASLASARLGRALGLMPGLLVCIGLAGAGYLGLGLTTAWWGFAFYFFLTIARGLNASILLHEEQRLVPSADRASFISARNLVFRGLFVAIGPLVGLSIDASGEHTVLLVSGAIAATAGMVGWLFLLRAPR